MPMLGFEQRISGVRSNEYTSWATNTAYHSCYQHRSFLIACHGI